MLNITHNHTPCPLYPTTKMFSHFSGAEMRKQFILWANQFSIIFTKCLQSSLSLQNMKTRACLALDLQCDFLRNALLGQLYVLCCYSVTQSRPTLSDPMDCSTPGLPVLHYLLEFVQAHVHWASDVLHPFHPLLPPLLLPSIFPSIRGFSNEPVLHIRWPNDQSLSFTISPSKERSRLISFRTNWFHLLAVQGTPKSEDSQYHSSKASILGHSAFFMVQLSHPYMTTGKTITLARWTFVSKVMFLFLNTLSRFVIAFLSRRKCLLISWLRSLSTVILELKKIKSVTVSISPPCVCHGVMGLDAMTFVFWRLSFKPAFSLYMCSSDFSYGIMLPDLSPRFLLHALDLKVYWPSHSHPKLNKLETHYLAPKPYSFCCFSLSEWHLVQLLSKLEMWNTLDSSWFRYPINQQSPTHVKP